MDLYETLGVARDATKEAIKKAFRRRARETHPDVGGEPEKFHAVELAHRILTDDQRRGEYDATGRVDERVDTLDAQAMSLIGALVERFLADEEAKFLDVVSEMRKSLKADIRTAETNRLDGKAFLARTKMLRTRFKGGKGAGIIDRMIVRKIEQAEQAIRQIDEQIEIRNLALALLEDASFDPEARPAPPDVTSWAPGGVFFTKDADIRNMMRDMKAGL